jgi:peptidoglycan/LPS O-acetylase OafA/YrhL
LAIIGIIPVPLRMKAIFMLLYFTSAFMIRPQVNQDNINLSLLGLNYYFSKYGMIFFIGVFISSFFKNLNNKIWMVVGCISIIGFIYSIILANDKFSSLIYCYSLAITTIWMGSVLPIISVFSRKYGDVSYGVYLYAFPIQQSLTYFNIHNDGIFIYIGLATLITFGLAVASWHWIEKPCLSLKYRKFINSK